jgi:hypothetical protein
LLFRSNCRTVSSQVAGCDRISSIVCCPGACDAAHLPLAALAFFFNTLRSSFFTRRPNSFRSFGSRPQAANRFQKGIAAIARALLESLNRFNKGIF